MQPSIDLFNNNGPISGSNTMADIGGLDTKLYQQQTSTKSGRAVMQSLIEQNSSKEGSVMRQFQRKQERESLFNPSQSKLEGKRQRKEGSVMSGSGSNTGVQVSLASKKFIWFWL